MNPDAPFLLTGNATATPWAGVPELPLQELADATSAALAGGARLCAWFGVAEPAESATRVVCIVADDFGNTLGIARSLPARAGYPSLTLSHPQAHLFERELFEQHGLRPEGHPWLKPVRRTGPAGPEMLPFFKVEGGEVHEVAVGPVHAGIIEPGHFRFQCAGEQVLHLEIALGYQHRGIEAASPGGPHPATLCQMETIAGDATIAHGTAYLMALEALAGIEPPLRAQWLRAIALELERLANHTGDLGALANDVAFLPTSSACGRLRGDFLNLTAILCGNRFGRRLLTPGGCAHDLDDARVARLVAGLRPALAGVESAADWLWEASAVRSRFEGAGTVTTPQAREMGLVGPAARASGLVRDIRFDHPAGWHRFAQLPVAVWPGGDVFARARVRWLEIQRSGAFLLEQLSAPPPLEPGAGSIKSPMPDLQPNCLAVSMVEGWRGETCHVILTGDQGRFRRHKIIDPSFHNWSALALALRGEAISDFPVCNKSFNLSYCGFDL